MATSLENYYTLKIGQTITPSQRDMLLLTTNASRVAYNVDVPVWQLPNGVQPVIRGYVLDSQLDITFQSKGTGSQ